MAASRSPGLHTESPISSTGAQPQPRRLKLRDSCENCAASKLKCGREKPACSRCLKQSKACNYVESKRAGRLGATRSAGTAVANIISTTTKRPITYMGTPAPTPPVLVPPPDSAHISLVQSPSCLRDMALSGSIAALEDSSALSPYNSTSQFFDISNQGTLPWLNFDFSGFPNVGPINTSSTSRDTDSSMELDLQGSIFQTPKHPSPTTEESTTGSIPASTRVPHLLDFGLDSGLGLTSTSEEISSEPQCPCMGRAFRLLQQLSVQTRIARRRSCNSTIDHTLNGNGTTTPKSTVVQNQKNVQEICDIARCACLEDPYLLSIICFLVIKVLSLYKSAIQRSKKTKPKRTTDYVSGLIRPGNSTEEDEEMRTVANSILRQLHLVQGVVSTLSPRLKANRPQADKGHEEATSVDDKSESDFEEGSEVLSLSANLLDQLEDDIRRHLRALSSEIVEILRRG
ncbi:hypothetical protein M426DRAFT_16160 [Hypoxylon sp. CI-4A]|nr:hypothetical protein M426DRAFT_16160 [Hypoxylon sp. CI-4A]